MDVRTPQTDIEKIVGRLDALSRRIDKLAEPSGSAANQTVQQLRQLVDNIQAQLNDYIANGTYNKAQIDDLIAGRAPTVHKHAASDIVSGGTTGTGFTVGGDLGVNGDVTGNRAVFPTGVRSTGARNTTLVTGYANAYIDNAGNFGIVPSTIESKNILGPYAVNMQKFLDVALYAYAYKDDPNQTTRMGPMADYLDTAGLTEFVLYDEKGKIQGLHVEALVVGLWSAYVQSRATTLARISHQKYQKKTIKGMTALGLNAEKTYDIVWDAPFFDAEYHVTGDVTTTGAALGAMVAVVPDSETATGCKVSVRSLGLVIASGATLTVRATHI